MTKRATTPPIRRPVGGAPDAHEIVEEFWPYDGPHTPERVTAAAAAIAGLARYLANATQRRDALDAPDLSAVIGHLAAAAPSLAQVLRQFDRIAAVLADDPALYDDDGSDARATAFELGDACRDAALAAGHLGEDLDAVHQLAARLGHRPVAGAAPAGPGPR